MTHKTANVLTSGTLWPRDSHNGETSPFRHGDGMSRSMRKISRILSKWQEGLRSDRGTSIHTFSRASTQRAKTVKLHVSGITATAIPPSLPFHSVPPTLRFLFLPSYFAPVQCLQKYNFSSNFYVAGFFRQISVCLKMKFFIEFVELWNFVLNF